MKIVELANSVDPDEAAHNEPSHQDLQCLPSSFRNFNMIQLGEIIFFLNCRCKFCCVLFWRLVQLDSMESQTGLSILLYASFFCILWDCSLPL